MRGWLEGTPQGQVFVERWRRSVAERRDGGDIDDSAAAAGAARSGRQQAGITPFTGDGGADAALFVASSFYNRLAPSIGVAGETARGDDMVGDVREFHIGPAVLPAQVCHADGDENDMRRKQISEAAQTAVLEELAKGERIGETGLLARVQDVLERAPIETRMIVTTKRLSTFLKSVATWVPRFGRYVRAEELAQSLEDASGARTSMGAGDVAADVAKEGADASARLQSAVESAKNAATCTMCKKVASVAAPLLHCKTCNAPFHVPRCVPKLQRLGLFVCPLCVGDDPARRTKQIDLVTAQGRSRTTAAGKSVARVQLARSRTDPRQPRRPRHSILPVPAALLRIACNSRRPLLVE